jgi:hypothetical protein
MKDFLKIFFILCGLVVAFVFGRNYGEKTITESKEYIKMRSDSLEADKSASELAALKSKFQDLLDSSDLKKADEILSKIMTIFLADLSLHLSEDKEKDLSLGKAQCAAHPIKTIIEAKSTEPVSNQSVPSEEKVTAKTNQQIAKYKSNEWLLVNSRNDSEIRRNLKKIELKDIDSYLKGAPEADFKESEKFFGSYRGRVMDVNNREYGLLSVDLKPIKNKKSEDAIKGLIAFFRNGEQESTSDFTANGFGYNPTGFSGTVHSMGNRRLQFYSIQDSRRLAGYMYERLPNGTTKTIGPFILNRVDQF